MNIKLVLPLIPFFAVLLTGCNITVAQVTAEPTAMASTEVPFPVVSASKLVNAPTSKSEPTAIPKPTESPTEEATPVATPTPEPTSAKVPTYVGFSADEVAKLRERCLQDNPDSLCLPLPFGPANDVPIEVVETYFPNGQLFERYLVLEVPSGAGIISPFSGEVLIRGFIPGGYIRWLGPGREVAGMKAISIGWGPFFATEYYTYPSIEFQLIVADTACTQDNRRIFKEKDLVVPAKSRNAAAGELLAQTGTGLCLRIYAREPVYYSIVAGNGQVFSGTSYWGRTKLSDLLTTNGESIVFVLPQG